MKRLFLLLLPVILGTLTVAGQTGSGKIDQWLVAGAFTSGQTKDLLGTPFIDEAAAAPADGEKAGEVSWKKLSTPFIDFTKQGYSTTSKCAGYAFTYIHSESDRLAVLMFGSDDGAMIWLNGARVLEQLVKRSFVENQDMVPIQLAKGWNRLLIKVDQGGGDWAMACSISADGIRISNARPASESLAKSLEAAITGIGIAKVSKEMATLSITISNYSPTTLRNVRCELMGNTVSASGKTGSKIVAGTTLKTLNSKASAMISLDVPLYDLCGFLSKGGALVKINSKAGTNEVPVESETATELLMAVVTSPLLADAGMLKSASSITSAISVYGITGDLTAPTKSGLEKIAAHRISDVKPILNEIAAGVIAGVPDLRSDSIYVIGHAHMDMNWLWPYTESVKMFHDNFRQVIAFMEQFPDYRMLQSQATIYKHVELADPPLFEKVKKQVAEGRFELAGGMWTEGDGNLTGGEAICRSLLLGQRYFLDKFGKTAHIGWLPDNFGHISQFPQMLKLSGMDYYYFFRCAPYTGSFWWVGPDSSKVLCYTNDTYNGEIHKELKDNINRFAPVTRKLLHPTGIGDHGGGPTLKNIELIHQLDATPKYPSVKFASVENFFKTIAKLPVTLPVHRGEMQYIFEGCYTSVAEIKENTRKSEQSLYSAEFLSSLRWINGGTYPAKEFKDLWETVAFNQFHDILPGSAIYESYQDAVADHKMVQKKANSIFETDFRKFSDEIAFKPGAGQPIVALNMQPRGGKVLVQADVFSHEKPATATLTSWTDYYDYDQVTPADGNAVATMMVRDGSGRAYPAQIIGGRVFPPGYRSTIEFVVDSMPAGGYRTFYVDAQKSGSSVEQIPEKEGVFETDWFKVSLDMKTGDIIGLLDKRTGKEYVSANGRLNQLRIWMEAPNGMSAWTIGKYVGIFDVTDVVSVSVIEKGPVRATIEVIKKWGKSKFIQRTYIYKSYPRIDFDLEAHWFETGDGVNPAPFLKTTFDLAIESPVFNSQVPFDVVSRSVKGQEVPAQQWVDVSDGKNGIALLNRTKFGHSFEDGQLRLSLLRASYYPDIYPNMGINHIQYSLYPHAGDWTNGVWAEGENFNVPVYAAEPPSLALSFKTDRTISDNSFWKFDLSASPPPQL
ncbi:MAG: glycoside hydrolase family 38 C-terminal domain-containing protein, partial [Bacteroidales bacterium]|nr:glycoside hydrolase family 38 C-terminal domain-containing protein [Bacteroidales bacterium]